MKSVKNLTIVILVLLTLLVLVVIRSSDQNLFKQDVKTALVEAQSGRNLLSADQLKTTTNPYLVVNLDGGNLPASLSVKKVIAIPFENLLDEANRKILEEVNGDLVLYSGKPATAAKAWIILNQLGFNAVFILSSRENPEVLKYKFQPDTIVRLEQDSI